MLVVEAACEGVVRVPIAHGLSWASCEFCTHRFLVCSKASVCEIWTAFVRFAARFSFRDLPDFLVIVCRGDLSDIAAL
jgi:hypothetical protein